MDKILSIHDLSNYVSHTKVSLLRDLKAIAISKNLRAQHLYKDMEKLFYDGNLELLKQPIIAIIGSRDPNQYAKHYTNMLSNTLSLKGFSIISGGAVGIDSIAHNNIHKNAIMVLPSGININYPRENAQLIKNIRQHGLLLSEYEHNTMPRRHSFLERNRIIIALSDIVIIPHANINSGSSSSANVAIAMNKPLYVLPHRLNESLGTQDLLESQKAKSIYNIESFIDSICNAFSMQNTQTHNDEIIEFITHNPLFEDALKRFGNKILEYELEGKIRRNGIYIEPCI